MTTENAQVAAPAAAATAAAAPVAAPVATNVAAPVAAPAAAAPASNEAPATFGAAVEYQQTGHAGIDMALAFAGSHGLSPDHPAMQAADGGNFGPLKALLASKSIPGWEQYVALAEDYQKQYAAGQAAQQAEIGNMCVSVAGSPEVWGDVLAWAGAEAEPAEREAINSALAGGGLLAEAMAHFLVNGYKQSSGTTYEGAPAVKANAAVAAPNAGSGPLDSRAYGAEVAKLHAKLGNRLYGSPELEALDRRRAAYRG